MLSGNRSSKLREEVSVLEVTFLKPAGKILLWKVNHYYN